MKDLRNYTLPEGESIHDPFGFDRMLDDWTIVTATPAGTLNGIYLELDKYHRYGLPMMNRIKVKFNDIVDHYQQARKMLQHLQDTKADRDDGWTIGDKIYSNTDMKIHEQTLNDEMEAAVKAYRAAAKEVSDWLQLMHSQVCAQMLFDKLKKVKRERAVEELKELLDQMMDNEWSPRVNTNTKAGS